MKDKSPWEANGWTRQEWMRWHRRHPESSSDHATLNPNWWARKGMKFHGGTVSLQDSILPEIHTVTNQKTSLLSVINTEYLFARIGQIKGSTLIVNEQQIHEIFFQTSERNYRGHQSTKKRTCSTQPQQLPHCSMQQSISWSISWNT